MGKLEEQKKKRRPKRQLQITVHHTKINKKISEEFRRRQQTDVINTNAIINLLYYNIENLQLPKEDLKARVKVVIHSI